MFVKKFFFLFFFSAFVLLIPTSLKRVTCGFKLAKLRLDVPFRVDWETTPHLSMHQLHHILNQPFTYLDKGAQCYVFKSEDEQYVIKLFRYDQPQFFKKKVKTSFKEKIENLFVASRLAYLLAPEETGLVHLHLNLTKNECPILHAKGPIGQSLHLPLDRYRFAVQKKVDPFRERLFKASRSSDKQEMNRLIDSFIDTLQSRIQKGIRNSDPTLSRNFGFIKEKAVEIDFGNYFLYSSSAEKEMHRYTNRLRRWLKHNAPEWVSYLDERVKQCE